MKKKKYKPEDLIPYCQNPAIGKGAPKCSEDCCNYGGCHKEAFFDHLASKYPNATEIYELKAKHCKEDSSLFTIDDRKYSYGEVMEILKKHKEEEDKEYHICDKCGNKYLENNKYNMVRYNLSEEPGPGQVIGYQSTPYISGIKILSNCGDGRKIKLCDKCIKELVDWLGIKLEKYSLANSTGNPALTVHDNAVENNTTITPPKRNKIRIGRKRR